LGKPDEYIKRMLPVSPEIQPCPHLVDALAA